MTKGEVIMNSEKKLMLTVYIILGVIFLIGSASLIFSAFYPYECSRYVGTIKKVLFTVNIMLPVTGIALMIWLFVKRNHMSANSK